MADSIALEMKDITKEFPGVIALNEISMKIHSGEIHALCGENGAGKSTLMKILSGIYPSGSYKGQIFIDGNEKRFTTIRDAEKSKIAIIYQEFALAKNLSIAENLFLGNEPSRFGTILWNQVYKQSEAWLAEVGLTGINPELPVGALGIGQQQLVEIAKALSKDAKILILDEPTAALTEQEVAILLNILRRLKGNGVTCIYISHKLNEVFEIADRITILRDGQSIATLSTAETTEEEVIALMVGRELKERFPAVESVIRDTILRVNDYSVYDVINPGKKIIDRVSFELRKGEILGIAGLMGAGRTELAMSIFGALGGRTEGEIELRGKRMKFGHPNQAIKAGIAYVSEDRKKLGLILNMNIQKNISLPRLDKLSFQGILKQNLEFRLANSMLQSLKIKANSVETIVGTLSGGNQQKVVLGKWLLTEPEILILDEPTRGIDVGAKYEIYTIMNELAKRGVGIIMISSELPELLGMSHRVLVISEGRVTGEFPRSEATQEKIMTAATRRRGSDER